MKKLKKLMILITLIFALTSSVFCYSVYAADNVTQLQLAHDNAEIAINTQVASPVGDPYYEDNSYQAFTDAITGFGGLVGIQAIIDEPTSLQVDVDNLANDLNSALLALITDDTYYSTLAEFSTANSIDLTPYTSDSQILYNAEMDRVEVILNNPTAGEATILGLNTDIDDASTLLVSRGDKTTMNDLISQIETIYASLGSDYIPSTFLSFQDSYDDIDTLLVVDTGKTLQETVDNVDSTVIEVQAAESRLNEVITILISRPDKTQLQLDYDTAAAIDSNLYTSSSMVAFNAGLLITSAVLNDLEAIVSDVLQATTDLTDLYSVLVLKGDVTNLQIAYNNAISQDLSVYTPDSLTTYQSELDRINVIILSSDTDQPTTNQALIDIQTALDLLVLQADRTNLEILNELLIKAYYEEGELYINSSHTAFKIACDAFGSYLYTNSIIADDNSTQAEVDALETFIQTSLDLLVPIVDNASLLMVYYQLQVADLLGYTTNSQLDYQSELDRIYQIVIGDELDSTAAESALLDLSELNDLLIELADYTELQSAYDSMDIYREEDYSVTSYSIFTSAVVYAGNMLTNLNATQADLDATIILLNDSVASLKQTIEPIFVRENATLDIKEYLTLGDASIVSYDIDDLDVVSVDSTGILEGRSYGSTYVSVNLSNGATEVIEVNVTAGIKLSVFVMTLSIPVVTVGLSSLILFGRKENWIKLLTATKNIFKKKK